MDTRTAIGIIQDFMNENLNGLDDASELAATIAVASDALYEKMERES